MNRASGISAPEVSVVTAVRDGRRYLLPSLESVLSQAGVNLELIVVDDGSTDGSSLLLEEIAAADRRVRVIRHPNRGLTHALIRGCAEARGEFIARHDADDLSLPDRLRRQVARLRSDSRLSMVGCWCLGIGPEGEVLWETRRPADPDEATDRLLNHFEGPFHGSMVFRRRRYEQVGGYRPEFYFGQDCDLWLRLADVGVIGYEPAVLYAYRVRPDSLGSRFRAFQDLAGRYAHECRAARMAGRGEADVLRRVAAARPSAEGESEDARRSDRAAAFYFIGSSLLQRGDPKALDYFKMALRLRPCSVKTLVGVVRSYCQGYRAFRVGTPRG